MIRNIALGCKLKREVCKKCNSSFLSWNYCVEQSSHGRQELLCSWIWCGRKSVIFGRKHSSVGCLYSEWMQAALWRARNLRLHYPLGLRVLVAKGLRERWTMSRACWCHICCGHAKLAFKYFTHIFQFVPDTILHFGLKFQVCSLKLNLCT